MTFDGSIASLVECYRSHERYERLPYSTRQTYKRYTNRILQTCGHMQVTDLNQKSLLELYAEWCSAGIHMPMGRQVRILFHRVLAFGKVDLNDPRCATATALVHRLPMINPWSSDKPVRTCLLDNTECYTPECKDWCITELRHDCG